MMPTLDAAVVDAARSLLVASQTAPRALWVLAARRGLGGALDAATTTASGSTAQTTSSVSTAVSTAASTATSTGTAAAPVPTAPPTSVPTSIPSASSTPATATGGEFPTLLLTVLIWSSLAVGLIILCLPARTAEDRGRIRVTALAGTAIPLVAAAGGINYQINQELTGGTTAFEELHTWISDFPVHVDYHLSVDGVSLPLLLLSTVLFSVAVLASWRLERRVKLYFFLLLLLETAVDGMLCSSDYVLFLLFFASEAVPVFLLVAVWGGPGRARAAWKYLAFALTSTALLLVFVVLVGVKAGQGSFEFLQVGGNPAGSGVVMSQGTVAAVCFWLSFTAFCIRLPTVPLHTWLADLTAEAGAPVGALLNGILLSMGGYGLLRITVAGFPVQAQQFGLVVAVLAAVGAVWGALSALAEDDLLRLVAYCSVGQMALVLLAVSSSSSIALNGAVLQLVAHGFAGAMLVLLTGAVQERTRTRSIRRLGGLAWQAPRLTALWVVAGLTSIGVPLLAGFVAEYEVFTGAFPAHRFLTLVVMACVVITTGYLLWAVERVFFGPAKEAFQRVRDATTLDLMYLLPLVFFILLFGVLPGRVIPVIENGVQTITARLGG